MRFPVRFEHALTVAVGLIDAVPQKLGILAIATVGGCFMITVCIAEGTDPHELVMVTLIE